MEQVLAILVLGVIMSTLGTSSPNTANGPGPEHPAVPKGPKQPKELAIGAFNALFKDYSEAGLREVFAPDIIQHNPYVPTGRDALLGFLPVLQKAGTTYQNHRLFQDREFAVMHNTLNNAEAFGAKQIVSFNVYRVADGKIVEHWGVPTPIVENPVGGTTQFGGETTIKDLDKTGANKAAAQKLFDVVINGSQEEVGAIIHATFEPDYVNHSPTVANGIPAVFEAFQREQWVYKKNHKLLGEGNFVLSISEGTAKGSPVAFYDLLRFENGKVAEHWDVIKAIPTEGVANDNGMFGF